MQWQQAPSTNTGNLCRYTLKNKAFMKPHALAQGKCRFSTPIWVRHDPQYPNPHFLKKSTAVTIAANQHHRKISIFTGPCEVWANHLSNSTRCTERLIVIFWKKASISELQQKPWFQCTPKICSHHRDYADQRLFWPCINLGETQSQHLPARKIKIWRYAQCLELFLV